MSVVIEYEKRVMKGCVIQMHSETCGYKDTDDFIYHTVINKKMLS